MTRALFRIRAPIPPILNDGGKCPNSSPGIGEIGVKLGSDPNYARFDLIYSFCYDPPALTGSHGTEDP